jgi:hypothetical protein
VDPKPTVEDAVALLTDRQYLVGSDSRTHHQVGSRVLNVLQEQGASEDEARMLAGQAATRLRGYVKVTDGKLQIYVPRDAFPPPEH